jgi:hypothetical protein
VQPDENAMFQQCFDYMHVHFGFCFVNHNGVYLLARRSDDGEFCYVPFQDSLSSAHPPIFEAMVEHILMRYEV